MKKLVLVILFIPFSMTIAQNIEKNKIDKNDISADLMLYSASLKANYSASLETIGLIITYDRVLFQRNILKMKAEIGLGIKYPSGESSKILIPYNIYLRAFLGKNQHFFTTGLGIMEFDDLFIVLPLGYSYQFSESYSLNFNYNWVLWEKADYYDGATSYSFTGWFWKSKHVKQFLRLGFSYKF